MNNKCTKRDNVSAKNNVKLQGNEIARYRPSKERTFSCNNSIQIKMRNLVSVQEKKTVNK